jgi:hypothetical protein
VSPSWELGAAEGQAVTADEIMGKYRFYDDRVEATLPPAWPVVDVTLPPASPAVEVGWPPGGRVHLDLIRRPPAEPVELAAPRAVVPRYRHWQWVTWMPPRRAGR